MARRADDQPIDPLAWIVNPDDKVTPASFTAWLDQLQTGEPVSLEVTAAETLVEAQAAGEV